MTLPVRLYQTPPPELDLAILTDDALRAEFTRCLVDYAQSLSRLAAIWVERKRRGEDMSSLRGGIAIYLPAIAAGTVLPETVVRFSGQAQLLQRVAILTPVEQQRLLDDPRVTVADRKDGRHTTRLLPVTALSTTQQRLVFGDRTIRTETEQIAILAAPPHPWKPKRVARSGKVSVDRTTETLAIGKAAAPLEDILRALRDAGIIPE